MKERPILFSGPLVRAILDGTKTQTRRLVKRPADYLRDDLSMIVKSRVCPYGAPGDRLWVRETCILPVFDDDPEQVVYAADHADPEVARAEIQEGADGDVRWRPSIHMPRWASRIDLEVTAARVERLQDITEEDARAEGVRPFFERFTSIGRDQRITTGELAADAEHRASFAVLWDEINGERALWISNPWVWALDFKRVRP